MVEVVIFNVYMIHLFFTIDEILQTAPAGIRNCNICWLMLRLFLIRRRSCHLASVREENAGVNRWLASTKRNTRRVCVRSRKSLLLADVDLLFFLVLDCSLHCMTRLLLPIPLTLWVYPLHLQILSQQYFYCSLKIHFLVPRCPH